MEIWNQSNGVRLAWQVETARTFWTRLRGWMGRESFVDGAALVIRPCNSIHTWFMQSAIDVVFVDAEDRIVEVLHMLPPYQVSSIVRGAKYVIELPPGTLASTGTRCNDFLSLGNSIGRMS